MVEAQTRGTALLLVYDYHPPHHTSSFALGWDCFGKLLPLRTKLLVIVLIVG